MILYGCDVYGNQTARRVLENLITRSFSLSSTLSREDVVQLALYSSDTPGSDNFSSAIEKPTDIDWDNYAQFRTSRVPGYVLWIIATILFVINLILSSIAPDVQLARSVATALSLELDTIPPRLKTHRQV